MRNALLDQLPVTSPPVSPWVNLPLFNLVQKMKCPENVISISMIRSHWMTHIYPQDLTSSTNPKAVIIVVIIVIVLLTAFLIILYYKREEVTDYIMERKKAKSGNFFKFADLAALFT